MEAIQMICLSVSNEFNNLNRCTILTSNLRYLNLTLSTDTDLLQVLNSSLLLLLLTIRRCNSLSLKCKCNKRL
jgi:hypothetical protein